MAIFLWDFMCKFQLTDVSMLAVQAQLQRFLRKATIQQLAWFAWCPIQATGRYWKLFIAVLCNSMPFLVFTLKHGKTMSCQLRDFKHLSQSCQVRSRRGARSSLSQAGMALSSWELLCYVLFGRLELLSFHIYWSSTSISCTTMCQHRTKQSVKVGVWCMPTGWSNWNLRPVHQIKKPCSMHSQHFLSTWYTKNVRPLHAPLHAPFLRLRANFLSGRMSPASVRLKRMKQAEPCQEMVSLHTR